MFGFFFTNEPVKNYEEAKAADASLFKKFFWGMFEEGVYLAPSPFEAGFVSTQHDADIISKILSKSKRVFESIV